MMNRFRLVWVIILSRTWATLCANKSSALYVFPISLPASELWYVALMVDKYLHGRSPLS